MSEALVVGASGLVGGAICRALGARAVGTYRSRHMSGSRQLDASDRRAVDGLLRETGARIVFFAAAEPNVEWCEEHPDEARERNAGPALTTLAAVRDAGARFVFFSSDYVFDGRAGPYDEAAVPAPVSAYGRIKLEIEAHVLGSGGTVIRTTTVFGPEPPPGKNFALRVVSDLRAGRRVRVPSDQVSTPTWVDDLARGSAIVASEAGIWNVAGPDLVSRDAFARAVALAFGLDAALLEPVPTAQLGQRAARPRRGGLRTEKLTRRIGGPLTPLATALARFREQVEPHA